MKPRIIKWRDSRLYFTQHEKEHPFDVCIITSVGYVIQEDKKQITLAGDLIDDEARRIIVIPKENII